MAEIKIGGKTRLENLLKQLFHSPLVGYEVIITNSRYALVGPFITSYPTRAHGIIVIYCIPQYSSSDLPLLSEAGIELQWDINVLGSAEQGKTNFVAIYSEIHARNKVYNVI